MDILKLQPRTDFVINVSIVHDDLEQPCIVRLMLAALFSDMVELTHLCQRVTLLNKCKNA